MLVKIFQNEYEKDYSLVSSSPLCWIFFFYAKASFFCQKVWRITLVISYIITWLAEIRCTLGLYSSSSHLLKRFLLARYSLTGFFPFVRNHRIFFFVGVHNVSSIYVCIQVWKVSSWFLAFDLWCSGRLQSSVIYLALMMDPSIQKKKCVCA